MRAMYACSKRTLVCTDIKEYQAIDMIDLLFHLCLMFAYGALQCASDLSGCILSFIPVIMIDHWFV